MPVKSSLLLNMNRGCATDNQSSVSPKTLIKITISHSWLTHQSNINAIWATMDALLFTTHFCCDVLAEQRAVGVKLLFNQLKCLACQHYEQTLVSNENRARHLGNGSNSKQQMRPGFPDWRCEMKSAGKEITNERWFFLVFFQSCGRFKEEASEGDVN